VTTLNIKAKGGYWLVEDDLEQPWGSFRSKESAVEFAAIQLERHRAHGVVDHDPTGEGIE
jgi:hypothetical protein